MTRRAFRRAALLLVLAHPAAAQGGDSATAAVTPRSGPPIRQISTASAVSQERVQRVSGIHELPDGRVLVNDGAGRRLLLLDTLMVVERVVLDSVAQVENTYGAEEGVLIAHRGDSALFFDMESLAMLVLDPAGRIVRVRSVPRARDIGRYRNPRTRPPTTDAKGRLVYRMNARPGRPAHAPPPGVPWIPVPPDSAFIVALDLDARTLDTLAVVRIPKEEYVVRSRPGGGISVDDAENPIQSTDVFTVMQDGTVAIVRAIDYHVDFLRPDGSWRSSGKIPYDWQPIAEDEKRRIVDSVHAEETRRARASYTTSVIRYVNTYNKPYPPNFSAPDGYVPPNGFVKGWRLPPNLTFPARYIHGCAPGEEPTVTPPADGDSAETTPPAMPIPGVPGPPQRGTPSCIPQPVPNLARVPEPPRPREVNVVSPAALPDYWPAFQDGAARADMDGNLWIMTGRTEERDRDEVTGSVYDVVSREGLLVDRLQLPRGYALLGFGRGRVVFLGMRDRQGVRLARVRLR